MKKLFLGAWLLLGITACSKDEIQQEEKQEVVNEIATVNVAFENVLNSNVHSIHPLAQNHLIIDNATDWKNLQDQIITVPQTTIDFNVFTVIAVFDQPRTDTGCTIDVIAVTEFNSKLEVTVDRFNKVGFALAPSTPYHIVKIPKTDKPVVFTLL